MELLVSFPFVAAWCYSDHREQGMQAAWQYCNWLELESIVDFVWCVGEVLRGLPVNLLCIIPRIFCLLFCVETNASLWNIAVTLQCNWYVLLSHCINWLYGIHVVRLCNALMHSLHHQDECSAVYRLGCTFESVYIVCLIDTYLQSFEWGNNTCLQSPLWQYTSVLRTIS